MLGAGAWGTALSVSLAHGGQPVRLWTWQAEHAHALQQDRENRQFLPGIPLPESVEATADLAAAVRGAEVVTLVVPSTAMRETLRRLQPYLSPEALIVSATKGLEEQSLLLMNEVLGEVLGEERAARSVALSGPSFAKEVAQGQPTNVVVASRSAAAALAAQQRFATPRLRVYTSDDPIGVEIGGALKNVIAIAAGACDGLGFGNNTRAALITRGLAELTRLAVAKGGHAETLAGLAGLGDLILTCTGDLSRNRAVGLGIGRGQRLAEVLEALGHVAEGVGTAKAAHALATRLGVDLPLTREVYLALYEDKRAEDAVRDVLARPLRAERG